MAPVHGKDAVIFANKRDLSCFLNSVSIVKTVNVPDITSFCKDDHVYLGGGDRNGSANFSGFYSGEGVLASVAETVDEFFGDTLGAATKPVFTVCLYGDVVGYISRLIEANTTNYDVTSPFGGVTESSVDVQPDAIDLNGKVLASAVSAITATGNGAAVDNAVLTSQGGVAHLHVHTNTRSAAYDVKVQHSVDDATYADLVTFTQVATVTDASQRVEVAAGTTVNRYLRAVDTVTAGTGSLFRHVSFARRYV